MTTGGRGTSAPSVVGGAGQSFQHVAFGHALDHMAIFGGDQFGGIGVNHIRRRRHHAVLHQDLDDVHSPARHAVGKIGHRDGFRNGDVARTGGTGLLRLMTLVDALQMAAIGGDRTHALVIAFQRAGHRELAAAALAFAGLFWRGGFGRDDLAADLLGLGFFFLFLHGAAAADLDRGDRTAALGSSRRSGFRFGMTADFGFGGLARLFFGFAFFRGGALGLELFFFSRPACGHLLRHGAGFGVGNAGVGHGGGAAGFFFVGQLAQHHAAARRRGLGGRASRLRQRARRLFGARRPASQRAFAGAGAAQGTLLFTTTALVRPWLKLCLTVEVSVFFSDSVLPGAWFRRYRS